MKQIINIRKAVCAMANELKLVNIAFDYLHRAQGGLEEIIPVKSTLEKNSHG